MVLEQGVDSVRGCSQNHYFHWLAPGICPTPSLDSAGEEIQWSQACLIKIALQLLLLWGLSVCTEDCSSEPQKHLLHLLPPSLKKPGLQRCVAPFRQAACRATWEAKHSSPRLLKCIACFLSAVLMSVRTTGQHLNRQARSLCSVYLPHTHTHEVWLWLSYCTTGSGGISFEWCWN